MPSVLQRRIDGYRQIGCDPVLEQRTQGRVDGDEQGALARRLQRREDRIERRTGPNQNRGHAAEPTEETAHIR